MSLYKESTKVGSNVYYNGTKLQNVYFNNNKIWSGRQLFKNLPSKLSNALNQGVVFIHNNELYVFCGSYNRYLYKWNGDSWASVSTLPFSADHIYAISYENEIHLLAQIDSTAKHYKYNGSSWSVVTNLPTSFYKGCAFIIDNKIHYFETNKAHYYWSGTAWVAEEALPTNIFYYTLDGAVLIGDYIDFYMHSSSSSYVHHKYNYKTNTIVSDYNGPNINNNTRNYNGFIVTYFNNAFHTFGGRPGQNGGYNYFHFSYNNSWTKLTDIPNNYRCTNFSAIINYNNDVIILGAYIDGNENDTSHVIQWNGDSWYIGTN